MAQNMTMSYHGVTPCMAVFGAPPRDFYEYDNSGILAVTGALQTDLSTFERAMGIRQTSLAQVQQAIIEDRIARAARTRPHQLDESLVAGTSETQYFRDEHWRGPALLLRVDADDGVAVIQYRTRPYLVSLRHVRPYRGIYLTGQPEPDVEQHMRRIMRYVESLQEYKVFVFGWLWKREHWIHIPKNQQEVAEIFEHANIVSASLVKDKKWNGMMMARSVRSIKPPHGRYLITWMHNTTEYAVQHRSDASCLKMKRASNYAREDLCHCYFYYYLLPPSAPDPETTNNTTMITEPSDLNQPSSSPIQPTRISNRRSCS